MRTLADLLSGIGAANSRGGQDTILAHINPREAALLKLLGGSGRVDPVTGGIHFDDDGDSSDNGPDSGGWSGDDGGDGGSDWSFSVEGWDDADWGGPGTAADFASYGWGNEDVGYQASPQEAEAAMAALAAQQEAEQQAAQMAAYTAVDPTTGRTMEEQQTYDQSFGIGGAQGVNATQAALDAANAEYNSLGWAGDLKGDPWSFVDALGNQQTNWGSIGRDAAQALGQYGGLVGALTGYGAIGAGIGALANLALGETGKGTTTLAGLIGGAPAALGVSVLGNLAQGNYGNVLGTLANAGLNYSGLGLGQALAGQANNPLGSLIGSYIGNQAQGALIGSALSGLGVSNSGQSFGGWTGTGQASESGSDYTDQGNALADAISGAIGSSSTTGQQGSSAGTLQGLLAGLGGQSQRPNTQTGYAPITLDEVSAETGYDLIDSGQTDSTLGGLMNLANAQSLYASSY